MNDLDSVVLRAARDYLTQTGKPIYCAVCREPAGSIRRIVLQDDVLVHVACVSGGEENVTS